MELSIVLDQPVFVTVRDGGGETEKKIDILEMREPTLADFSAVSLNDPTLGQLIEVAARCCVNIPASKVRGLSASNLLAVSRWVGSFLHSSR
ncbi:MAG: phage tail assembly protein [Alphaproteobacteria bacterium]|nr:phage tail assembly protein [Alphaproteobacteria bacterium]